MGDRGASAVESDARVAAEVMEIVPPIGTARSVCEVEEAVSAPITVIIWAVVIDLRNGRHDRERIRRTVLLAENGPTIELMAFVGCGVIAARWYRRMLVGRLVGRGRARRRSMRLRGGRMLDARRRSAMLGRTMLARCPSAMRLRGMIRRRGVRLSRVRRMDRTRWMLPGDTSHMARRRR